MKYVLDTNIVSYSINRRSPFHTNIIARLSRLTENDSVCISVLTYYEAEYGGLCVTPEHQKRVRRAREIMRRLFEILPVSVEGARAFGRIKLAYRQKTGMRQKLLDQHNIDLEGIPLTGAGQSYRSSRSIRGWTLQAVAGCPRVLGGDGGLRLGRGFAMRSP